MYAIHFNPRPRKEGDISTFLRRYSKISFQSTPSQRGRRSSDCCTKDHNLISIHALAKRATTPTKSTDYRYLISIHALAKRATFIASYLPHFFRHFNPRPRKEGDLTVIISFSSPTLFQSTPSQRGRLQENPAALLHGHFNPRPRKEGDRCQAMMAATYKAFQSTPSQRGRPRQPLTFCRSHRISIHALAKRATAAHGLCNSATQFQSTPSQRGRRTGF